MTKRQKGIKFMQKRIVKNDLEINAKTGRIEQACARYGVGRSTMKATADKAIECMDNIKELNELEEQLKAEEQESEGEN